MPASPLKRNLLSILLIALVLSACTKTAGPASTSSPTAPATLPSPTETPIPMAAVVNGEGILASEYSAELSRYQTAQSALGNTVSAETAKGIVLNDLVDQVLLAQGAAAQGIVVEDATLQIRIDALTAESGGAQALLDWQAAHGYTEADFRSALRRQIAAAWMRDQIAASVPATADQVHVKQILFYNAEKAESVWAQLQAGEDFETLAALYDPVTQGELGWFPRGYLFEPVVEEAAFSLQPGEYSEVLESEAGYQIILVIERDPVHPLSPDAHLTLQINAIEDWLIQKRAQSTINLTP